jgi:hypothetical protein
VLGRNTLYTRTNTLVPCFFILLCAPSLLFFRSLHGVRIYKNPMGLCRVILQDARTRRSLIPFLLLQPISRTREQSPPLGDIPSALRWANRGKKTARSERDTPMYIYTCINFFPLSQRALCAAGKSTHKTLQSHLLVVGGAT